MDTARGPRPLRTAHLRVARPSLDLAAAERFWVEGLGMHVLWRTAEEDEHDLMVVGWPGAAWHLELVRDPAVQPRPTEEDLLVLYLDGHLPDERAERVVAAGGRRVTSRNPYWDEFGVTFEDPDGYRLVLSHRDWDNGEG